MVLTANYDGKDNPVTGDSPYGDVTAMTRIDPRTTLLTSKLGGKPTVTQTIVVSSDGKTRTTTTKGTNAKGEAMNRGMIKGQRDLGPPPSRVPPTSGRHDRPTFDGPSVPPEHLLRALLLQVLYSIRSERLLMEQLEYNLLFRWFVGLGMDDAVWTPTTFTKNRERLLAGDVARAFFDDVVEQARGRRLLSDEHFTVDGTLLEAWAGQKSFRRKGTPPAPPDDPGNPTVNFHGERRSNTTHQSTTDPDSRLFKKAKGHEAKLGYLGEVLMENRHGLVVDACVVPATGTGERDAAASLIAHLPTRRRTIGGDKGYDTRAFVAMVRALGATPHIAQQVRRHTLDRRTTRHAGYAVSQRVRKRIEEVFGWMKTVGGMRKLKHRGGERVNWQFLFTAAAYNLVRMRTLMTTA